METFLLIFTYAGSAAGLLSASVIVWAAWGIARNNNESSACDRDDEDVFCQCRNKIMEDRQNEY